MKTATQRDTSNIMAPEMMRLILGGEFPNTGFSWKCVSYFKLEEDGTWQPYNGMGEILPAHGFKVKAKVLI